MAEKRGAGGHLAGVLERAPRPEPTPRPEAELAEAPTPSAEPAASRGRGARAGKVPAKPKATGRTVYIDDDLWERIIVQAHRRKVTISDYVAGLLNRHVPDHRRIQPSAGAGEDAA